MGKIWFVHGGARSGKSRLAENLARSCGEDVLFIATMQAGDKETAARIERHRAGRPIGWTTVESPIDVVDALDAARSYDAVILDCLTLWLTNQMLEAFEPPEGLEATKERIAVRLRRLIHTQERRREPLIAVSNEVGAGVVPVSELGRQFRDLLGESNQTLATAATRLYQVTAGHYLELKSLGAQAIAPTGMGRLDGPSPM